MNWILWILLALSAISLISAGITAFRYRRQIQTAWLMFKTFRQIKQKTQPQQNDIPEKSQSSDSPLVRCSKCQKWTPQDSAVKLKSNYFCSHSCMEKSFTAKT
jgi:formylmethanofuran dehydrogenase subunit E